MKQGGTAAAAGSIIFAMIFNILLFVAAPLLLTNALFIGAGWAPSPVRPRIPALLRRDRRPVLPSVTADSDNTSTQMPPAWYSRAWRTRRRLTCIRFVLRSLSILIDGVIRMSFFLIMIFSFSLLKDIRRVFEYHGAEHKTVFTWEAGLPLDGCKCATTAASASALRHELPDGGDAGLDCAVLGNQV